MEDPQDPHRRRAAVLDAVLLARGEMEARARAQRDRLALDVREAFALDDVTDLVVGVAVERRLARLDDPDELRHVEAAGVFVDEVLEGPFARGRKLRLVGETDCDAPVAARRLAILRRDDRDEDEVVGAWIVDRVRLARGDEDACFGRELVAPALEIEVAAARDDIEDLLVSVEAPLPRPALAEPDEALLEQRAAVRAVEGDSDLRSVPVAARRGDVVRMDDVRGRRSHARSLRRGVQQAELERSH